MGGPCTRSVPDVYRRERELPLINDKVVITDTVDADGELIASGITSINGRVVDVCELLDR